MFCGCLILHSVLRSVLKTELQLNMSLDPGYICRTKSVWIWWFETNKNSRMNSEDRAPILPWMRWNVTDVFLILKVLEDSQWLTVSSHRWGTENLQHSSQINVLTEQTCLFFITERKHVYSVKGLYPHLVMFGDLRRTVLCRVQDRSCDVTLSGGWDDTCPTRLAR